MAGGLKAGLRSPGKNLTSDQRAFLVTAFACYQTVQEVLRSWAEHWPDSPVPSAQALYNYRLPLVLQGPHAEAFQTERDRYKADLPAFAAKDRRIAELCKMVESLDSRIAACVDDERREVTAKTDKGIVRSIRATRVELEREKRATLDQIDNEMGKVIKLEHSGPGGGPIMVIEVDNRTMVVPEANGHGED